MNLQLKQMLWTHHRANVEIMPRLLIVKIVQWIKSFKKDKIFEVEAHHVLLPI